MRQEKNAVDQKCYTRYIHFHLVHVCMSCMCVVRVYNIDIKI